MADMKHIRCFQVKSISEEILQPTGKKAEMHTFLSKVMVHICFTCDEKPGKHSRNSHPSNSEECYERVYKSTSLSSPC
ncbi:hypothetical protein CEXT_559021 [Caerostris extrusa]|uniref:Uncharacterized protein n=1 Tax=Caerostris extrusa TaxID=172846 RepID=A0AAV4R957_CAEEX|nr:hypothetical protein CEXT_559021 [Caerostris extrusa]